MTISPSGTTRFDRRRARTRAALVSAAQSFLAEGRPTVAIQEITDRADVGVGTFYNHFGSREELLEAAVTDALELYGLLFDSLGDGEEDPAAFFAQCFRLTGRLHRAHPQVSRVLLANGHELSRAAVGVAPRARRDLAAAHDAGRFVVPDVDVAMVMVTGAMVELGHLLHEQPDRDADATTDAVTVSVLTALGMERSEAEELCARPLPEADPIAGTDLR